MIERRMYLNEELSYLTNIIVQIREDHPTMSCRLLYYKINPATIGRDRFEELCKEYGFQVDRPKSYRRTTNSSGVIRFENLLNDLILTSINQAYSSDITYFEIGSIFYYITFIMDCFSRKILGFSTSGRLTTEQTTIPALLMAIKARNNILPEGIIFHSDGGGQYYDKEFLRITESYKFRNSMCEYAYENGKAERLNGVIKNNYLIHWKIKTLADLTKSVDRAVHLYNTEKPHSALNFKTPMEIDQKNVYLNLQTKPKMKESLEVNS